MTENIIKYGKLINDSNELKLMNETRNKISYSPNFW